MFIWFVMIVILTVAGYVTPFWRNMYIKMKYYLYSMKYLIQTDDLPKKFTGTNAFPMDSKGSNSYVNGKRVIRIVFIRHGQSVWNSIFNAFGMGWPMRVLRAITYETINFFMNPFESILIDSPLSAKGKKEAMELSSFLATAKDKLSLDPATSVIVSSNLRRAMETALVGLESRMRSTHERIAVCSSLQEGSRNVDAQSLSTEKGKLAPMFLGYIVDPAKLHTVFDPSLNEGNKKMGINVYQRMDKFVQQMIGAARGESLTPAISESIRTNDDLKEIIVVGHSGYFRNFFRRFLPVESSHVSKKSKMQNCAAVSFNLVRDATSGQVTIEESSIMVLYRGFK